MDSRHKYLAFIIKILSIINMWYVRERNIFKELYILVGLTLSALSSMADFVVQFNEDDLSFTNLMESMVAVTAWCSVIYTLICFMIKKREIKRLTENLRIFEEFLPTPLIELAEQKAAFYTKIFVVYGIVGNISYASLPLFSLENCTKHRSKHMVRYGVPCGSVGRYVLPFRQDYFPMTQFIIFEQAFVSTLGTIVVMSVTMLICGIVTHVSANLKHLKLMISNIPQVASADRISYVNFCIRYHTAIIDFTDQINKAFSAMMLVHITWTSLIISILGIEVILIPNYMDSFRYSMHLGGWLGMLFLICVYGQILMDSSTDISRAIFETKWYEISPSIRRSFVLILLRSQRPLVLKAAGVNIMALSTFLGVLSTAYSYFTLFLNIQP